MPCCSARRTSPIFFRREHRGSSACRPFQEGKKGWLKGRLDLSLGRSKPCSHAGCLVELGHCFASLPICQMGLLLHSGTTGMGARQEPAARWRLSDLAAPDICAGNKKGHWCRWLYDEETALRPGTNQDHWLLCLNDSNWTELFPTVLICE